VVRPAAGGYNAQWIALRRRASHPRINRLPAPPPHTTKPSVKQSGKGRFACFRVSDHGSTQVISAEALCSFARCWCSLRRRPSLTQRTATLSACRALTPAADIETEPSQHRLT
jgi:hypothetical protein